MVPQRAIGSSPHVILPPIPFHRGLVRRWNAAVAALISITLGHLPFTEIFLTQLCSFWTWPIEFGFSVWEPVNGVWVS